MVDKPPMAGAGEDTKLRASCGWRPTLDQLSLVSDSTELLQRQIVGSKIRIEDKINSKRLSILPSPSDAEAAKPLGLQLALSNFSKFISQSNYRHYFSFDGKVINRRHFECDWPLEHVIYFLKSKKF